ncbi:Vmc-like lipoprotein signal peptide domain-containing protein [Ureaplasma canigenitalium]|uniref:Vmc-like lipoprotein signal peptide domain-containing protein n=1 Tax=Ureaplasma canigenitalium TaxID=42092 RepID=UPI0006908318|nr:hypothetical protein [Ureaplasma canigenitalium]
MKKLKLNKKLLFSTLAVLAIGASISAVAVACRPESDKNNGGSGGSGNSGGSNNGSSTEQRQIAVDAKNYGAAIKKLLAEEITVTGAWGDAGSVYGKNQRDDLIVIGATAVIANDGVQVRETLKQGDIDAVQKLFIDAINVANENQKKEGATKEDDLLVEIEDKGKKKIKSAFSVYNHEEGYSALNDKNAEITTNPHGDKKKVYSKTPDAGSDYLEIKENKVTPKAGSKKLKIEFIPSGDPKNVQLAVNKMKAYFDKIGVTNLEITVSTSYDQAASNLSQGTIDVAFLPADTWATKAGKSHFILQAGRSVQIIDPYKSTSSAFTPAINDEKVLVEAMNNYRTFNVQTNSKGEKSANLYVDPSKDKNPSAEAKGYPKVLKDVVDQLATEANGDAKKLGPVGFYRSYIYVKKGSPLATKVLAALESQGNDWKLPWSEVKNLITYGYTSKTSSASYTFPEAWFQKHFTGFTTFEAEKNK